MRWRVIPSGWSIEEYENIFGKQESNTSNLTNGGQWTDYWWMVEPKKDNESTQLCQLLSSAPWLWALERAGGFSPACLFVRVVPSLPVVCLLREHTLSNLWGQKLWTWIFLCQLSWLNICHLDFLWHTSLHLCSLGWRRGRGNPEINTLKGYPVKILLCFCIVAQTKKIAK